MSQAGHQNKPGQRSMKASAAQASAHSDLYAGAMSASTCIRFHSTLSIHASSLAYSHTRHTSHQAKQQPIKPPKDSLICLQTFHRLSTTIIPTFSSTSPAPVLCVTLRVPALHHSRNTSSTPPPHPTTLPQHVLPFQAPASKTSPCLGNGLAQP